MKPTVFIGASVESGKIVDALLVGLDHDARCTAWYNAFPTGPNSIDSLMDTLRRCDFGIFVFAPDDSGRMRDKEYLIARDNVVFEAGLFMGMHGKDRTFIVVPRNQPPFHLASDLWESQRQRTIPSIPRKMRETRLRRQWRELDNPYSV